MKFIKRWLSTRYPLLACQIWGHEPPLWQRSSRYVEDREIVERGAGMFPGLTTVSTWYRIEGHCTRCGLVEPINELDHLVVKVSRDGVQVETTPVVTPYVGSSIGVWEATTNLITNGGFESNTTGRAKPAPTPRMNSRKKGKLFVNGIPADEYIRQHPEGPH